MRSARSALIAATVARERCMRMRTARRRPHPRHRRRCHRHRPRPRHRRRCRGRRHRRHRRLRRRQTTPPPVASTAATMRRTATATMADQGPSMPSAQVALIVQTAAHEWHRHRRIVAGQPPSATRDRSPSRKRPSCLLLAARCRVLPAVLQSRPRPQHRHHSHRHHRPPYHQLRRLRRWKKARQSYRLLSRSSALLSLFSRLSRRSTGAPQCRQHSWRRLAV